MRFVCFKEEIMCNISKYFEYSKLLQHKIILWKLSNRNDGLLLDTHQLSHKSDASKIYIHFIKMSFNAKREGVSFIKLGSKHFNHKFLALVVCL